MQTIWAALIFLFSSGYVLLLDYFAFSSRGLQKSLVLPLFILLFIIYRASIGSWKSFIHNQGRWFLLLWGTILIQTLVVATGGLQSPFLIMIHLSMIAMSFFIGFTPAVIFLLLSFIVILIDISFNQNVITFLLTDPSTIVLQLVSLFSIVPLAYIISQQYHIKDMLTTMLRSKVTVDEAIFESLDELIIVTDAQLTILSVNDAVEQTLQKPRSELLQSLLFSKLLLKDSTGKLATKETFFDKTSSANEALESSTFTIINAAQTAQKVSVHIQTIKDLQSNTKQFSFVLSPTEELPAKAASVSVTIEKARAKYEAMLQSLKQLLQSGQAYPSYSSLLLAEKIENDLYNAQSLSSVPYKRTLTKIDFAVLCKKLVDLEQEFAKAFQVNITFGIQNFGHEDIAPLTVKNFPVDPEKLTGPFFTIPCDVKNSEIVMKKLLELAIFIASSTPNALIESTIKRNTDNIVIQIKTPNPQLKRKDLADLLIPNYGKLPSKTNILAGSGLEGYLIQQLTEKMQTPVTAELSKNSAYLTFTWVLKKKPEEGSKQAR
jgi:PAS domain-containing protein